MELTSITEAAGLKGARVLVRVDFNVPIADGKVDDDFRIQRTLPTIKFLQEAGAKVILISRIGREPEATLRPVWEYLKQYLPVEFIEDIFAPETTEQIQLLPEGGVMLCENLRRYGGETKGSEEYAKKLAVLADLYVNEAFSASHRPAGSIVEVTTYLPSYAGLLFLEEIKHLSMSQGHARPFLFVLGGAKFETKLPLIQKYLDIADWVFMAGALANDFFLYKGYEVGRSLVSNHDVDLSPMLSNPRLVLPMDVVVQDQNGQLVTKDPKHLETSDKIVDIGQTSLAKLENMVTSSASVLWNGPLGEYEHGCRESSLSLARVIVKSQVRSVVGGGDTLDVISELGLEKQFTFISTAGGAMLEFLQAGTLVGIEALKNSPVKK